MLYVNESVVADARENCRHGLPRSGDQKSGQITRDDLEEQMEKNRVSLNNRLPKYMQVTPWSLLHRV